MEDKPAAPRAKPSKTSSRGAKRIDSEDEVSAALFWRGLILTDFNVSGFGIKRTRTAREASEDHDALQRRGADFRNIIVTSPQARCASG